MRTQDRSLDGAAGTADAQAMSESPYAQPLEEFTARWRVPVTEQTEAHASPGTTTDLDWRSAPLPWADGGTAADCDCD